MMRNIEPRCPDAALMVLAAVSTEETSEQTLIKRASLVQKQCCDLGYPPESVLCSYEWEPCDVRTLVKRGADVNAVYKGVTPMRIALECVSPEMVRVLLHEGAQRPDGWEHQLDLFYADRLAECDQQEDLDMLQKDAAAIRELLA